MSTTSKPNERKRKAKAGPIDIDAAMARLILLRRFHELPRPTDYNIYYGGETNPTHTVSVTVATRGEVIAWADALGIRDTDRRSSVHHGAEYTNAWAGNWHGWHLNIRATVALTGVPAGLDADTVAGLEEIAAEPKPLVSDETIAEAEQISKMVAPMDLGLPQAECGCPIKGSGLGVYIDHCQACIERTGVAA